MSLYFTDIYNAHLVSTWCSLLVASWEGKGIEGHQSFAHHVGGSIKFIVVAVL